MPTLGRQVLVVEDDDSMRESIERLLRAAGYESVAYASAEALLMNGAAEGAACVVTDFKLPALSGFDLLDAIRARGCHTPVILVTAHDGPAVRQEAERRGFAAYLTKPFRGAVLLDAIRVAIEAAAAR
jgi:FixJ family two-component response regulator